MFKQLFSSLSILGVLSSSTPALSTEYSDHPYRLPFGSYSYRLPNGFASNASSLEAMEYFSNLAFSDKLTKEGYPYRACGYYFDFYAEIDLYPSDRVFQSDWDLGGRYDDTYYYNSRSSSGVYSPITITKSRTNYRPNSRPKLSMSSTLNDLKTRLINELRDYQIFIQQGQPYSFFYSSDAVVGTKLRSSDYFRLGCDQAPIEEVEPEPTCPNLVIRGLPFIRNTITCHLKNR